MKTRVSMKYFVNNCRCISFSAFGSLSGIPIGITSSETGLKICAIAAGIKKYESRTKKKEHDKIESSVKSNLNSIEVLIFKALVDSDWWICFNK